MSSPDADAKKSSQATESSDNVESSKNNQPANQPANQSADLPADLQTPVLPRSGWNDQQAFAERVAEAKQKLEEAERSADINHQHNNFGSSSAFRPELPQPMPAYGGPGRWRGQQQDRSNRGLLVCLALGVIAAVAIFFTSHSIFLALITVPSVFIFFVLLTVILFRR